MPYSRMPMPHSPRVPRQPVACICWRLSAPALPCRLPATPIVRSAFAAVQGCAGVSAGDDGRIVEQAPVIAWDGAALLGGLRCSRWAVESAAFAQPQWLIAAAACRAGSGGMMAMTLGMVGDTVQKNTGRVLGLSAPCPPSARVGPRIGGVLLGLGACAHVLAGCPG